MELHKFKQAEASHKLINFLASPACIRRYIVSLFYMINHYTPTNAFCLCK
jgi:hypothetical protein